MIGLRRPGLIFTSAILAVLLLFAEYWLLLNNASQKDADRYGLWGAYGLNTLNLRLQSALDFAEVLAHSTVAPGGSPNADYLDQLTSEALEPNSPFDGIGLVREVPAAQRAAFESSSTYPIQILQARQLTPSPGKSYYYPIIDYLPDDSKGMLRGLDLGDNPGWGSVFLQARDSGKPLLADTREGDSTDTRLDIIVSAPFPHSFILLNINKDRLLDIRLPSGDAFLHHLRLIAWGKDRSERPWLLLDSHPNLERPHSAPITSFTSHLGNMEILFGTYPLDNGGEAPNHDNELLILALSASGVFLLLAFLYRLSSRNKQFQGQLSRQNTLLEQNNQALRQQITERIHSEQARTESEMRQRAILQASSDAIMLIDHGGILLDVNPSAAHLIGQPADALAGLAVGALISELYDSQHPNHFEMVAVKFLGMPFEAQLVRSDRSMLPVEISLSRVSLPDDLLFLLVFRDISIRKEQEAALIRLKNSLAEQVEMQGRQLTALLDASPLAMAYIVDRQLKLVNRAFLDLFDCDEAHALNFSTRQFFLSDEQYDRSGRQLYHQLNEGKVITTELQLKTGRGDRIWCRLHAKALNPSVPGLGTIWLYQDFSSERAAEDALRAAKELAEETSRAKTEFLANMSHELRTPMHAILGFAEMGQGRADLAGQEKIRQYFQRIISSGNRLLSLLNDLLDLAKMEVGRMEYHPQLDDLEPQLREACEELGLLANTNGIRIECICHPTPMMLEFDALRIGQVLRNLLSNAIKFSAPGGVILVEGTLMDSAGLQVVRVSVTDHGPGVPPLELETIFEKFTQSSGTKTGAGGSGLGLAICREIIHAHKGEIQASNSPLGGAVFSFTLPLGPTKLPSKDKQYGA